MRLTVRRIALLIVLVGLNLAAFRSASRYSAERLNRRSLLAGTIKNNGFEERVQELDGSEICYRADVTIYEHTSPDKSNPHLLSPPNPSLLRIWSPLIASVAFSVLVIVLGFLGVDRRLRTMPHQRWVWAGMAVLIWLTVPVIQIVVNPNKDYHVHKNKLKVEDHQIKGFISSVHENPFWVRYWRYLLGRPSPGDYVCPLDHQWSIPPPHRKKEWLIF